MVKKEQHGITQKKFELLSYRLPQNKAINEALPFMNSFTNYTTPSGVIIERKPVVRDLGVLLSDDFSFYMEAPL